MRHRPVSTVRVLDHCARCGTRYLRDYDVRRVSISLPTPGGVRRHELIVCRSCEREPDTPTVMEQGAMACDLTNPVEVMDFMQIHFADPARVLRTAEYFLPPSVFAETKARVERRAAELRAARAKRDEERLARTAERWNEPAPVPDDDDDDDELGDFGFGDRYDE